jgi:predicted MFS family arabinose efflux permease
MSTGADGLLARRDFRRLMIGQAVSALGDWMGTVALMVLVMELTGSSTAVAGVLVLRLLPAAVAAPVASRAVARWDPRRVMLGADLARLVMVLLLPLGPWLGWVYFWAFAVEVAGLVFLPARDAAIPVLTRVPDDRRDADARAADLTLANGIMLGTSYGTIPLGAGAFGLVLLVFEQAGWTGGERYVAVFWLDALTYLVSYLAIRGLGELSGPDRGATAEAGERAARPAGGGPVGLTAALRIPLVRAALPAIATAALGLGALFSLGVVYVDQVLGAGPVQFGVLVALFGVGAAAGLLVLRRQKRPNLLAHLRFGVAAQGAVIAAMGVLDTVALAFPAAAVFGAVTTVAIVSALSLVQDLLDGTELALALAALHITTRLGLAVAALLAGAAADLVGPIRLGDFATLAPAQAVLLASGLVVCAGAALVRYPVSARQGA